MMNTLEQQVNRRANEIQKELKKDDKAYVETIGRDDASNLVDIVDNPDRATTSLRLVMGATATMPYRALTYVDSLLHIARIIPATQIQIVHANNIGNKVNGIDLEKSNSQARLLGKLVSEHMRFFPDLEGKVLHAFDTPLDTDEYLDITEEALKGLPDITSKLRKQGLQHGGNPIRYSAAHYAYHDTDRLELCPMSKTSPSQIRSGRIVSVGCRNEADFYRLRMAMHALRSPDVDTSQIFTQHNTPSYFLSKRGEPTASEGFGCGTQGIGDPTVRRDLEHFYNIYNP